MILNYLKEMIPYMLAALVILAAFRIIRHKKAGSSFSDISWPREAGIALLTAILTGLMAKTVLQGTLIIDGRLQFLYQFSGSPNFIPFKNLDLSTSGGFIDMLGNTLIFIPVGLLFPLLFRPFRRWWVTVGLCFLLSLFIEISQLFLPRTTDITDLLLNTTGGVIGYLIYFLVENSRKRKKKHNSG